MLYTLPGSFSIGASFVYAKRYLLPLAIPSSALITCQLGAVAASSVAYIPPLVTLAIGVLLAKEQIELWEYAGVALILLGVVLVNRTQAH